MTRKKPWRPMAIEVETTGHIGIDIITAFKGKSHGQGSARVVQAGLAGFSFCGPHSCLDIDNVGRGRSGFNPREHVF